MSSYYDCSPETNNKKVKVYSEKTTDIINNITGLFMLLTSIGVTLLIIFGFKTAIDSITNGQIINLLFLLTFACISIITGLIGMYHKKPNMSIFGFTSFIFIGVYVIFLFISGKLKELTFPPINNSIISGLPPIPTSFVALAVLFVGLFLSYFLGYGNIKKPNTNSQKYPRRQDRLRINREIKHKRNTASVILSFSLLGATLFVTLVTVYINSNST